MRLPRPVQLSLPLPGWHSPFRVVQLTDLHAGWPTPDEHLHHAVALANLSRPDLVVLTGDYVGYSVAPVGRLVAALEKLTVPTVAVLGNHDHWADADFIAQALTDVGIVVLRNERVTVGGLQVVGVDDYTTGHTDVVAATAGLDGPALGLSHHPSVAPALWACGVPLVLSGHTHAGQVSGPWTRSLGRALGVPHFSGLHGEPGAQVYVSAGIGSAAIPLRSGRRAWREVTVLDLAPPLPG